MALPVVNVTVKVLDANNTPVVGAPVTARLNTQDLYQNQVVPRDDVSGVTDVNGQCILALFPNKLGEVTGDFCGDGSARHTSYQFTVRHPTTNRKLYQTVAVVPNAAVNLTDIAGNVCSSTSLATSLPSGEVGFADAEVPAGVIDGANRVFTLTHVPNPALSFQLAVNGLGLRDTTDYTLNSNTLTYAVGKQPQVGDDHRAWYRYAA